MATILFRPSLNASAESIASYPKNFISFWSEEKRRGGHETTLLNTTQIVRIVPIFDPTVTIPSHDNILYLNVHLVDGKVIKVEEEFADFYSRVRISQAR